MADAVEELEISSFRSGNGRAKRRTTVLVSATLTKQVSDLAKSTLEDPVFIDAQSESRASLAQRAGLAPTKGKGGGRGGEAGKDEEDREEGDEALVRGGEEEGISLEEEEEKDSALALSTPKQLVQQYVSVPTKWRLVYIFGFLFKIMREG